MEIKTGDKYLLTTNEWFFAPDGNQYKSVHGTVHSINTDKDSLGISTNRHSSNWFVCIGNMIIAGCQIHYAVKTESVNLKDPEIEIQHDGSISFSRGMCRIYSADPTALFVSEMWSI